MREITELALGRRQSEVERQRRVASRQSFPVNHWGARMQYDNYRGYNGYVLERNGRSIVFAGDTALTNSFADLRDGRAV